MLVDTHVHLNADQYEQDVDAVIKRAREAGVSRFVVIGFDTKTIDRTMELIETYEDVYGVIGWHPVDAVDCTDEDLARIESLSEHPKIVGIGETGLDYHWDKSPKDVQKEVFKKQIELAKRVKLPLVIHNRNATGDVVEMLEAYDAKEVGGIMHAFSSSKEIADRVLALNFMISLGGPVTFKNAKEPKAVAQHVPLEKLLIETDAPYLTPHPYRGKRNEPFYITLVAEEIARLKGLEIETVAEQTTQNAFTIYHLMK